MSNAFREIKHEQFAPFLELMAEIEYGDHFDFSNPEHVETLWETIRRRYGAGTRFYALYDDDVPVGIMGIEIEKMLYTEWSRAQLMDIGVLKQHRRGGYGSKLLQYAEQLARDAGCWALHLLTYAGAWQVIAFYGHNDYAPVGCVADTNGPDDEGDIWMRKILVDEE